MQIFLENNRRKRKKKQKFDDVFLFTASHPFRYSNKKFQIINIRALTNHHFSCKYVIIVTPIIQVSNSWKQPTIWKKKRLKIIFTQSDLCSIPLIIITALVLISLSSDPPESQILSKNLLQNDDDIFMNDVVFFNTYHFESNFRWVFIRHQVALENVWWKMSSARLDLRLESRDQCCHCEWHVLHTHDGDPAI